MNSFIYDTLPTKRHFRYLVLQPGDGDDALIGELRTAHIDQALDFDAISYVWGSPLQVSEIECAGNSIRLTASLRDVLRSLRLPDKPKCLWADQICINQGDIAERSRQVALMADIYKKSKTTLVHLGKVTPEEASNVASLLAEVNDLIRVQMGTLSSWDRVANVAPDDPITVDERWMSIGALTQRPWFDRVWVVQEAGLSSRPVILFGDLIFEWETVFRALKWVQLRATVIAYKFHLNWHGIHMDREEIWCGKEPSGTAAPWSFLDVMHASRQLQATEIRDHLFAFLGHPAASHPDTKQLIITPDYARDIAELHLEFATRYIQWTKNLDILSFVQEAGRLSSSWVPSWAAFDGSVLAQLGEAVYNAGGARVKTLPSFPVGGKGLNIEGVLLDDFHFLSPTFLESDFSWGRCGHPGQEGHKWAGILEHVLDPSAPYIHQGHRFASCAITATIGISGLKIDELESAFSRFLVSYRPDIERRLGEAELNRLLGPAAISGLEGESIEAAIAAPLINRRFAISKGGRYGVVPSTANMGDTICVIIGAKTPFVIRRTAVDPGEHTLVGECYVQGIMNGEMLDVQGIPDVGPITLV